MAGVIEIVTDGPEARPSGGLALDLGSPNKRDAGGRITGSRGKVDFLLSGNSFATDGFRLPGAFKRTSAEDGGLRANSDRARHDVLARIGHHVSESLKLGTLWTVGSGSYGIPPSTIDDRSDIFAQQVRYDRIDDYRAVSGQASFAYLRPGSLDVRGWFYLNRQREEIGRASCRERV